MKTYNRSKIMKRAYKLMEKINPSTGSLYTYGEAQKQSWKVEKVEIELKNGFSRFAFIKKSTGEKTHRVATRNLKQVPPSKHPKGMGSSSGIMTIKFFDCTILEWRSFNAENLAA